MTQSASPVEPAAASADQWTGQSLRWIFQHTGEVVPTARVSRGGGPIAELPQAPAPVGDVPVRRVDGGLSTVGGVVRTTHTDGFLVLHDGKVVHEQYPSGMRPDAVHLLMSVTKSLVGCVAGCLVEEGLLDLAAPLTTYVPDLAVSGYAGATVRQVLDMRSGITFSEDYLDPLAEIRRLEQCIGWGAYTDPTLPGSIYEFLLTLRQGSPHGGPFRYRSCETDVLGWVCERASGVRMPDLMSDLLWRHLGVDHDAQISLDRVGNTVHDGGMSTTMRDLARFGQMLLHDGHSLTGQSVLPSWWVRDSFTGDPDSREAFAASLTPTGMPGGMYRNQFWLPYPDDRVLLCLGIHGQMVYVNRSSGIVGVKFSSWPVPQDAAMLSATVRAFDAVAAHLAG